MSAREDHAARVLAGVSEAMCWKALFDEIDRLRAIELYVSRYSPVVSRAANKDRADWCPSRYQDTENDAWFWNCREALGHAGPHRCDGASWPNDPYSDVDLADLPCDEDCNALCDGSHAPCCPRWTP